MTNNIHPIFQSALESVAPKDATKSAAFTPGPWVYEGSMNGPDIRVGPQKYWEYCGKKEKMPMQGSWKDTVAIIPTEKAFPVGGVEEANARLIAAAPELYEALVALTGVIHPQADNSPYITGIIEAADAAIKKARGEQ